MTDVKPFQIWDVRENEKAPWREARVISMRRDAVALQFLDIPSAPQATWTFNASRRRMLSDRSKVQTRSGTQMNDQDFQWRRAKESPRRSRG
jgi:hypothetical protein